MRDVSRIGPRALTATHHFDVAVVIDVLRATSTAAVLMGRGLSEMLIASALASVSQGGDYLVVSELTETRAIEHRIDNSPVLARHIALAGRTPVLITRNGTKSMFAAAAHAPVVLLASFLNLAATCRHIPATARVVVVPAGHFDSGEARCEDDACAEVVTACLRGDTVDFEDTFRRIRTDALVQRRLAREPDLHLDVDLSLTPNLVDLAIAFRPLSEGFGRLRPAGQA